jgi:Protein of unknown function (DUF2380)
MRRSTLAIAATAALYWTGSAGGALAEASNAAPEPIAIAIAALDYTDTSGEVNDQRAAHQELLRAFTSALQNDLSASGKYRAVPITCGAEPCASQTDALELQKAAQVAGARLVVIGGVHKMSTLVQWAKIQIVDEDEGRIVFDRSLTFRGDTRLAWERAETFTAREILASSPGFDTAASTSPRIKIAVFDFELEDFSGGSSLIPESASDTGQLKLATDEARRLIAQSAHYGIADVSSADAAPVKTHELRKCGGCDAGIALKLGADQSLVGIVTRISRTDYAVTFKLRDASTGALIAVEQTDLRLGTSDSWNRGAAWLIKRRLLEKQSRR